MPSERPPSAVWPLAGPFRRLREYLRAIRQLVGETRDAVYATRDEVGALTTELAAQAEALARVEAELSAHSVELTAQSEALTNHSQELAAQSGALTNHSEVLTNQSEALADLTAHAATREGVQDAEHQQLVELFRFVLARGPEAQEHLRRLRGSSDYELSFSENDPLVSVVVPTYNNYELLATRAIPSVLAQSYQNFEVVVVGDAAPDEAREVVEGFGDPRISFFNLPYRGPYPSDPEVLWLVVGTPPFNEATHRARGRWIAPLDDDDSFRPNHLERLLQRARADRLELAYGQIDVKLPGGRTLEAGSFPPQYGQFNFQAAMWHAGLSDIFNCHLSDAALRLTNDWALIQRMMEAGVRIGFVEEVMVDYYPAKDYWESESPS